MANRFQFALPEPRPRDGWFRVGGLDITTTALLVLAGIASMFLYAIDKTAFYKLSFQPILVRNGELWRVFTWPLANQPSFWVVLTFFFFWIIGNAVESMVGRVRFTFLIVVVTVVPAVFVTLLPPANFPTADAAGLTLIGTAMFVVFAAEHPHMPFFFGVPGWVVAAVFVGIDILQVVGDRLWGTLVLMLGGMLTAVVIVRQWGFVNRLTFIPKFTGGGSKKPPKKASAPRRGPERRAPDRRGSVVEGPWSAPVPPRPSTPTAAAAEAELDELLDKISANGLDSLSTDEKRRLNELSKRLR